jgi:hypothetical protein
MYAATNRGSPQRFVAVIMPQREYHDKSDSTGAICHLEHVIRPPAAPVHPSAARPAPSRSSRPQPPVEPFSRLSRPERRDLAGGIAPRAIPQS